MKCPLVACSAHTGNNEKEKAFEAGFDNYITKPVSKIIVEELFNTFKI